MSQRFYGYLVYRFYNPWGYGQKPAEDLIMTISRRSAERSTVYQVRSLRPTGPPQTVLEPWTFSHLVTGILSPTLDLGVISTARVDIV